MPPKKQQDEPGTEPSATPEAQIERETFNQLPDSVPTDEAPTTRPEFAERINIACKKSVEAIFEVGRLLIQAKARLPKAEWASMIETDLPFKQGTADRFIQIASDTRLASHVEILPPHWGTLETLHKLSDATLNSMVEDK